MIVLCGCVRWSGDIWWYFQGIEEYKSEIFISHVMGSLLGSFFVVPPWFNDGNWWKSRLLPHPYDFIALILCLWWHCWILTWKGMSTCNIFVVDQPRRNRQTHVIRESCAALNILAGGRLECLCDMNLNPNKFIVIFLDSKNCNLSGISVCRH